MKILKLILLIGFMTLLTSKVLATETPYYDQKLVNLLSTKKIRLVVMRHGEAVHNLARLMTSTKSPGIYLTAKGIDQVQGSANKLLTAKIDHIYVSPVYRTLQTAQIVGTSLQIPYQKIQVDERLREQFFGSFEDRTYEEYEAYFPSIENVYVHAVPEGESGIELFSRTHNFLHHIIRKHNNETLLLITHAYNCCQISYCLTGSYNDLPEKAEYKIYDFSEKL